MHDLISFAVLTSITVVAEFYETEIYGQINLTGAIQSIQNSRTCRLLFPTVPCVTCVSFFA